MKILRILPILLLAFVTACSQGINYGETDMVNTESRAVVGAKTFPYTTTSFNIAKPTDKTQAQLNADVLAFYNTWKATYVKPSNGNTPGGYYVEADATGSEPASWGAIGPKSHSEAHGFGMVITALMDDKIVYDGLYAMYNDYRSVGNSELMSWVIPSNEDHSLEKTYSASDGDLDIAYSLLLADNQWGSNGTHNYKAQALKMIAAIKLSDFHSSSKRIQRGDWDNSQFETRPSDWMISHFRTFYNYTNDSFWLQAIDEVYTMINEVITTYSPVTNLLSDFIEGDPARPDQPPFLEGETDDDYSWNASRYPWRIAMDYGQFGEIRSKEALDGLVSWALVACNNDPNSYSAGYKLDGTPLVTYSSNAFYSPLAVAASHDAKNSTFLNNAWDVMKVSSWPSFFGDTITMQCLLYISGNWWVPQDGGSTTDLPPTKPGKPVISNISYNTADITWTASTDDNAVAYYLVYAGEMFIGAPTTNSLRPDPNGRYALSEDNEHTITVIAVDNKEQQSARSEATTFRTLKKSDSAPTKPGTPVVSNVTQTSAKISWTPSTDDFGFMGYLINITGKAQISVNPSVLEYTFTGLTANTNYTVTVQGVDNKGQKSVASTTTFTTQSGGGNPILVPTDPSATGAPAAFTLSKNNWNGESTYKVTANMWWGNNATLVKLYENGVVVKTLNPTYASPSAQSIVFDFTSKAKGTYTYKLDAINQYGTTTSGTLTISVTQ